jgi:dUTP pyrophosphatase
MRGPSVNLSPIFADTYYMDHRDDIQVKVKRLCDKARLPEAQSLGAAGFDAAACLEAPLALAPLDRAAVPTGLALEIPDGYEAQVRPRSGLALKKGITVLNSPGTIDSDYRGELNIILINLGNEKVLINDGDRIAQIVFARVLHAEVIETK